MNDHTLVLDFDEALISKLKRRSLVVRTHDENQIQIIGSILAEDNGFHALQLIIDKVFSSIRITENWSNYPVRIFCRGIGDFKIFLKQKKLLDQLNVWIYLPASSLSSTKELKIMASLGIHCGLYFNDKPDWKLVNDLMVYTVYNRAKHAPIEPFRYVLEHYDIGKLTDFSSIYFDNPREFLHIDEFENIALTRKNLQEGKFIDRGVLNLENIKENPDYKDFLSSWRDFFMEEDGCAYCEAWRICQGKFTSYMKEDKGCLDVFKDLMEAAESLKDVKPIENTVA